MTDPRKPAFEGVIATFRAANLPNPFNDPGNRHAFHNLLDAWGAPRQAEPSPAPPASAGDPIPANYFELLAKIESGNRPYIKAKTSSASGLFQFIRSTWRGEGGAWGSDMSLAFGGLKPTIEEQRERAHSFTMKNVRALQAAGVPINNATLYAAHFLGVGTAIKMLKAAPGAVAATIAGAPAAKANPSILGNGRTVQGFRNWLEGKTGVKP